MYLIKLSPTPATPQDSVDNIPSLDQCWLQCIAVLSSFANNSFHINDQVPLFFSPHPQTAEFAIDRLQRCLLRRGDTVPSGMALLKCYDATVFPLLSSYGRSDRDKSYIIGIATSSLLASSEVLAQQPAYASLWLRFIDLLCRFIREGGAIGEMTTERMKNLLMVMMVEKRFDTMSAAAGQNVLEATMTMLDSYCPAIRSELDRAFSPTENPKPDKVEEKEVKEEKMEEEVKEEVKEAQAPEISIKPIEITPVSIEIYLKTTIETRVWCKLEDSKSELSVEAIKTGQQRYVPERVTLFFSDLLPATEYGVWCYAETKDGVPMKEKPKEKVLFVTTDVSGHSIFV